MPRVRDQAICIRHMDWSETSQVVVLLTQHHGRLRGLAKGAKRTSPSSVQRFSGGIALLTRGELVAVTRSTAELAAIVEWDLQDPYPHLHQNLRAQHLAMYAADIVHTLIQDEDPHPRTFAALAALLDQLAATDPAARERALLQFQWDLLDDAGFKPELHRDVHSAQPLPAQRTYTFDPAAGGLTREPASPDWRVRRETAELLRRLAAGTSKSKAAPSGEQATEADQEPAPHPATVDRANRLLCSYLRWTLERELPTMPLILNAPKPGARA